MDDTKARDHFNATIAPIRETNSAVIKKSRAFFCNPAVLGPIRANMVKILEKTASGASIKKPGAISPFSVTYLSEGVSSGSKKDYSSESQINSTKTCKTFEQPRGVISCRQVFSSSVVAGKWRWLSSRKTILEEYVRNGNHSAPHKQQLPKCRKFLYATLCELLSKEQRKRAVGTVISAQNYFDHDGVVHV